MSSAIEPLGLERQPIPLSAVRPTQVRHVEPPSATDAAMPVQPTAGVRGREQRPQAHVSETDLLADRTRKALLTDQAEHPLDGPHPTD